MNDVPTRAKLLEECRARGLKATGWKKDRMVNELAKLQAPEALVPAPSEVMAEDREQETEAGIDEGQSESQPLSSRFSGWCQSTPLWSYHHLDCVSRKNPAVACACACHAENWVQPPVPLGAILSRGNPQYKESAL